jgi:hypothetical protein
MTMQNVHGRYRQLSLRILSIDFLRTSKGCAVCGQQDAKSLEVAPRIGEMQRRHPTKQSEMGNVAQQNREKFFATF